MGIVQNILDFFVAIFDVFFKVLFDWLISIDDPHPRREELDAQFGNMGDLVSRREDGFILDGTLRRLSLKDSFRNVLLIGTTGTGKTTCGILPNILAAGECSLLIHDLSGELYQQTAGWLSKQGYEIKVINFTAPIDLFNPLHRIESISDTERISDMIVRATHEHSTGDKFWQNQSVALISVFIRLVKCMDAQYANFANVRALITQLTFNRKGIDTLFAKYADDALFMEYKGIISYEPRVFLNIVASAKSCFNLFSNPAIQLATSGDTIHFEEMRTRKTAVFIQNRLEELQMINVLTAMYFEQFFGFATRTLPKPTDLPMFAIIDEVAAIRIPILPLALAQIRKYRTSCLLALQDINQLSFHYGAYEKETILSNCITKVYYPGQGRETSEALEKMLGRFDVTDDKQAVRRTRALLTSDEIRTMPENSALIMSGTHLPIIAELHPAYKTSPFRDLLNLPLPPLPKRTLSDTIPLIPIPKS